MEKLLYFIIKSADLQIKLYLYGQNVACLYFCSQASSNWQKIKESVG